MEQNTYNNPFTPSFGEIPHCFAGRDNIIREMETALDKDSRSPELTLLISGARGTGKTALLAKICDQASQKGWIAVKTVASQGMLEDIYQHVIKAARHLISDSSKERKLSGLGIGQLVNLEWQHAEQGDQNWRIRMEKVLDELDSKDVGILIAVDEVDVAEQEMIQLARVYQMMIMDNRKVALVMAGLPHSIQKAKTNKNISFVRRAQQRSLARIADFEVEHAIRKTVELGQRKIDEEALQIATRAAMGFPFMIQLVGYRMWQETDGERITADAAIKGAELAYKELENSVLESTYRELSDADIEFLKAMMEDEGASTLKDVAIRLGKQRSHVSIYKERLLKAGVIGEPDRNMVDFDLPGFRDYLRKRLPH